MPRAETFTLYPQDLPKTVQMNAGVIVDTFDPDTRQIGNILGATENGFTFKSNPTYEDFGSDIANIPGPTWQLKRLVRFDPVLSGTFKTVTEDLLNRLNAGGDFATSGGVVDKRHIIPSHVLTASDFQDVWAIGDYGNTGFIAIHLKSTLNTIGLQWKTQKDGKGTFDLELHAHYDLDRPDDVPYEVYVIGDGV